MKDFARWLPIRLHWTPSGLAVDWAFMSDIRFTHPFFAQTVEQSFRNPAHLLFRRETSMDVLGDQLPGLPPRGFIFHGSRCGSTLIAQMLAALPENIVISEAAPIDIVLRAHLHDPAISDDQRIIWLRWLLNALGQRRFPQEKSLFVKFDSWHACFLPLIQRAFPNVPWIFVYREPVEVLLSHTRQRGGQMIPGVLEPAVFGWDAQAVSRMSPGEYGARALARIYEAGLEHARTGPGKLVNYRQLPAIVWPTLMNYWGLDCPPRIPDSMARVCQFHAKNPILPFAETTNPAAPEAMHQFAQQWLSKIYRQLELQRTQVTS
ncbi:MAG TPA: sulfotransferase family protein [Verrucomicrobiae bacterium]|nr:sulfotransferase family protein [Verrucomicrobiae bacterium]